MAHPGGRPTKYKPEYCETVIELLNQGRSIYSIARALQVAKSTLQEWAKEHEEFSAALTTGKDFSKGWWEDEGQDNLHNKEFNSTLWYMNMKNRHGYSDKTETNSHVHISQADALKVLE